MRACILPIFGSTYSCLTSDQKRAPTAVMHFATRQSSKTGTRFVREDLSSLSKRPFRCEETFEHGEISLGGGDEGVEKPPLLG